MRKKTVLITGCSSGFGKLTAKTFWKNGWSVIATMRSPEREMELTNLNDVLVTKLDVTAPDDIKRAVDEGLSRFGAIDVVVNNAGYGGHALFEQMDDDTIRRMYDTNVFGVMNVTRVVLPLLRKQNEGCIINVTSDSGMVGGATVSVYCSTKFAVEGLTESLAQEYKPLNIRVKTVAPGAYDTGFNAACDNNNLAVGDEQLRTHAQKLLTHMQAVVPGGSLRPQGAGKADPQEVADKIYECATEETPIHNPVGADAELLDRMKNSMPQQEFLDKIAELLVPPN